MAAAAVPEHIAISKSKGVKIDWEGGHRSEYSLALLRDNCPCASCTGSEGGEPQKTNYMAGEGAKDEGPFKMYKPAIRMQDVNEVGTYAIRIFWNDGHSTGIYSFRHLRDLCPCQACAMAKQGSGATASK